ncbi:MAG: hypothetical protein QGI55_17320 [Pseudomonadales bacterium]|jgi:hypothetical protein|nr:hypothetical protein [Pseudomonadales bacterium]|tara:strand:- start:2679 stop:2837 length:159 start_codon:yes stop_codon:yes gene_type:complete
MWLGVSPNLAIWGNGLEVYTSSTEGKQADAIFAQVIGCESDGLWFSEQVLGQ